LRSVEDLAGVVKGAPFAFWDLFVDGIVDRAG
jgi:hypothetical protein